MSGVQYGSGGDFTPTFDPAGEASGQGYSAGRSVGGWSTTTKVLVGGAVVTGVYLLASAFKDGGGQNKAASAAVSSAKDIADADVSDDELVNEHGVDHTQSHVLHSKGDSALWSPMLRASHAIGATKELANKFNPFGLHGPVEEEGDGVAHNDFEGPEAGF